MHYLTITFFGPNFYGLVFYEAAPHNLIIRGWEFDNFSNL